MQMSLNVQPDDLMSRAIIRGLLAFPVLDRQFITGTDCDGLPRGSRTITNLAWR